jgi:hypothetical protein
METKLEELIEELGQQEVITSISRPFNQPDLIAISSINRTDQDASANGFSSFSVDLPLPAIDVKTLQLLQTNIPQANANIPNTACVFWYYRLGEYSGQTPSINNLYYVRLLPTTYKQEYIYEPAQYGYNQTFNSYSALAVQLAKSSTTDLLFNNLNGLVNFEGPQFQPNAYVPFLPNDISITYDTASNKFKMTGLNTKIAYEDYNANTSYVVGDIITNGNREKAFINIKASLGVSPTFGDISNPFPAWVSGTNYAVGQVITFNQIVYQLTIDGENVNQNPAIQTPAHYTRLGYALAPISYTAWVSGTNYNVGDVVLFNGGVYVLFNNGENQNQNPSVQPTHWVIQTSRITRGSFWKRMYIEIAGGWFANQIYPTGTIIEYEGTLYRSLASVYNIVPTNPTYWTTTQIPENWYRYLITGYDDPNVRKMQGELFNVVWNNLRTYNTGEVVEYNGLSYVALQTNRGSIPIVIENQVPSWNIATGYTADVVVQYNGFIYMSLYNGNLAQVPSGTPTAWAKLTLPSANPGGLLQWNPATSYSLNALVLYNGFMYFSVNNDNVGNNPYSNSLWWALRNYDNWNPATLYASSSVVAYQGDFYQSQIVDNIGLNPFDNPIEWLLLGSADLGWNAGVSYSVGEQVSDNTGVFRSLVNNNAGRPPFLNPSSWELLGITGVWDYTEEPNKPNRTGLYGLTEKYDMTEFVRNDAVLTDFPYGVGGQPYNPVPRRLLNSIIGFTWSGRFDPALLSNITSYSFEELTTRQQPLLYNRLRPVPFYSVSITPPSPPEVGAEVGQDQASTISQTYTADGYANLVYSSVISIYADVVKASSVDTQGATRLLALTSMNCGNLGISFWANYLENPLLKVQGNIYSIFIEFRDEFGEPFMLTNNAVATLTFKLNY